MTGICPGGVWASLILAHVAFSGRESRGETGRRELIARSLDEFNVVGRG